MNDFKTAGATQARGSDTLVSYMEQWADFELLASRCASRGDLFSARQFHALADQVRDEVMRLRALAAIVNA